MPLLQQFTEARVREHSSSGGPSKAGGGAAMSGDHSHSEGLSVGGEGPAMAGGQSDVEGEAAVLQPQVPEAEFANVQVFISGLF